MTDNIISLRTRKSLKQTVAEEQASEDERKANNIAAHLGAIDNLRKLVADGQVEGLILIGRHVPTGIFYQDVIFPFHEDDEGCSPLEALAYTGCLEVMKTQFADLASWAPCIMPDGSILKSEEMKEDE